MRLRHFALALVQALALWVLPQAGTADQLVMNNGSILIGSLVKADADQVVFNTPFAGDITIRQGNIKSIVTEERVNILMRDGRVYRDKRIVAQEEDLIVFSDNQQPVRFDVLDIKLVNPEPWRLGEGYKWYGFVDASLEAERGNTDTDELDLALESIWRGLEDRFTLRGTWEIDENDGERNKYRWLARGKYDRFSTGDPDNYAGIQAAFEHDEFSDIDLRSVVGPYLGRQFIETGFVSVQGELGIVRVDENFDTADDEDYWGATWELRASSGLIPGIDLYAEQTAVVSFTESDNVIVNTTVGTRFPVIYGFQASAEAAWKYDGGAVEGVDDLEEVYRFKLGYFW